MNAFYSAPTLCRSMISTNLSQPALHLLDQFQELNLSMPEDSNLCSHEIVTLTNLPLPQNHCTGILQRSTISCTQNTLKACFKKKDNLAVVISHE